MSSEAVSRELVAQYAEMRAKYDLLAAQRGHFLDTVIRIEGEIDVVVANHFRVPEDRRDAFFAMVLRNLDLVNKIEALAVVIEQGGIESFAKSDLVKRLHSLRVFRNDCAHASVWNEQERHGGGTDLYFRQLKKNGQMRLVPVTASAMEGWLKKAYDAWLEVRVLQAALGEEPWPFADRLQDAWEDE